MEPAAVPAIALTWLLAVLSGDTVVVRPKEAPPKGQQAKERWVLVSCRHTDTQPAFELDRKR